MSDSNSKKFTVRMPEELYNRLKQHSEQSYIPMSRLILIAVDEYLRNNQNEKKYRIILNLSMIYQYHPISILTLRKCKQDFEALILSYLLYLLFLRSYLALSSSLI